MNSVILKEQKLYKDTIHAKGVDITIYTEDFQNEFLSLTDIQIRCHSLVTELIRCWRN